MKSSTSNNNDDNNNNNTNHTPCGSGDHCIQPWSTMVLNNYRCNRCQKGLHPLCAAIDATKAPEGQFDDPDEIHICFTCLREGENPNQYGIVVENNECNENSNNNNSDDDDDDNDNDDDDLPASGGGSTASQNYHNQDATVAGGGVAPSPVDVLAHGTHTKRGKIWEKDDDGTGAHRAKTADDLNWDFIMAPHESVVGFIKESKVTAPHPSKRTIWWKVFHAWNMEDFPDEVPQPIAFCNVCGKRVNLSKADRSPTPLKRHIEFHHKTLFSVMYQQKLKEGPCRKPSSKKHAGKSADATAAAGSMPPQLVIGTSGYYHPKKGKKEEIRKQQLLAVVQWIVKTDQPLSIVEEPAFRFMTKTLILNPRHCNNFTTRLVEDCMSSLISELQSKIQTKIFGGGGGTAASPEQSQQLPPLVHVQEYWKAQKAGFYMVDRAQWIDGENFQLQSVVLACDSVDKTSQMWSNVGVDLEKHTPILVSNMSSAFRSSSLEAIGPVLFHGLEFELHSIAKVIFDDTLQGTSFTNVLRKVRVLIESVQNSPLAKDALARAQSGLTQYYPSDVSSVEPIIDVVQDAWWSTQEMVGRMLYLRKAWEYLVLDNRVQGKIDPLTRHEWDLLEQIQQLWEPLSIAPQLLQKQTYVTISLVPIILQVIGEDLDSLANQDGMDAATKSCAVQMLTAWEHRYGKSFPSAPFQGVPRKIWLAHVLDPRFKSLDSFQADSSDVIFKALFDSMVELRLSEKPAGDSATEKPTSPLPAKGGFQTFGASRPGNKRGLQRLSDRFAKKVKRAQGGDDDDTRESTGEAMKIKQECRTELDQYKATQGMQMWIEHDDGTKAFEDPLTWWKLHHERFPTLWKLARMYLSIPATCSRSEIAFDLESHADIARRCQSHVTTTSVVKLLKENAELLDDIINEEDSNEQENDF